MEIIYLLVPLGVILLIIAIGAFSWAVKNDQFDDMEGPAHSILFDSDTVKPESPSPQTPSDGPKPSG